VHLRRQRALWLQLSLFSTGTASAIFDSPPSIFCDIQLNDFRSTIPLDRPEHLAVDCLRLAGTHFGRMDEAALALASTAAGKQLANCVR